MKKIKTLFERDFAGNKQVFNKVVEGCEWVVNGEGIATRKYDGCCCMVKDGNFYKRHEVKKGKAKPNDFISADKLEEKTGNQIGWVKVDEHHPSNQYFMEGFRNSLKPKNTSCDYSIEDGTYELCGPKVQNNLEKLDKHILIPHGKAILKDVTRNFEGIKEYLRNADIEGIVFYRGSGEMAKIKKKDFGFSR